MKDKGFFFVGALLLIIGVLVTACQTQTPTTPSTAIVADVPVKSRVVWTGSYKQDIQTIFDQYCVACHGPTQAANGLRLDTYLGVMKGTQYGRVIIPGEPGGSTLLTVLNITSDPKIQMPHGNITLSKNRIENISIWIQAGAPDN